VFKRKVKLQQSKSLRKRYNNIFYLKRAKDIMFFVERKEKGGKGGGGGSCLRS